MPCFPSLEQQSVFSMWFRRSKDKKIYLHNKYNELLFIFAYTTSLIILIHMDYIELLKAIGITSIPLLILFVIILFFGQKIVNYFFDKKIENDRHSYDRDMAEKQREFDKNMELKRQELALDLEKHKANLELESKRFQSELELKQNQFNIQFSKLHQDRAEVIKDTHAKLVELHSAMCDYTALARLIKEGEDEEENKRLRIERANKALIEFNDCVISNSIFFEKSFFCRLNHIRTEYGKRGWDYNFYKEMMRREGSNLDENTYKRYWEQTIEISNSFLADFPPLIEELEDEFRKLLGVVKHE